MEKEGKLLVVIIFNLNVVSENKQRRYKDSTQLIILQESSQKLLWGSTIKDYISTLGF